METSPLDFIVTKTDAARSRYKTGKKISFGFFVEDFINGKIDIEGDFEEFMQSRANYFDYGLTANHFKFLFSRFIPEVLIHSKNQDERIVREHYDRGNDFFAAFLGPRMVYTSGFWIDPKTETLEKAQDRKMEMVCKKLMIQPGDKYLDIGCGWGTLVTYASKYFGANSTGVTLAQEGTNWGMQQIKDHGLNNYQARILRKDYRDTPEGQKWNRISCLEMGEHVGVRKFKGFIQMIYDKLEDDGKFYIQQAGLRANPGIFQKGEHWQDLIWGLFMNEYIFSGADASLPLKFLVGSLQSANFEVGHIENIGIHYSHTLHCWYYNWMRNEDYINNKYGNYWFRLWQLFLRWSVDIAKQGSSACWAITAHKNLDRVNRNPYITQANIGLSMNLKNPRKLERIFEEPFASLYNGAEISKRQPSKAFQFADELVHQTNGFKK
ncbi:MAG: class I SAM-dependent methyltransferase [Bacteroidota bacterium]|nr:class I SAM-dependent methyltransferase [Bacteroidota bacterium]